MNIENLEDEYRVFIGFRVKKIKIKEQKWRSWEGKEGRRVEKRFVVCNGNDMDTTISIYIIKKNLKKGKNKQWCVK